MNTNKAVDSLDHTTTRGKKWELFDIFTWSSTILYRPTPRSTNNIKIITTVRTMHVPRNMCKWRKQPFSKEKRTNKQRNSIYIFILAKSLIHINATQDRHLVIIINALVVNHKTYNSNKGRKTKSAPRTQFSSSSPAINRQRPSRVRRVRRWMRHQGASIYRQRAMTRVSMLLGTGVGGVGWGRLRRAGE